MIAQRTKHGRRLAGVLCAGLALGLAALAGCTNLPLADDPQQAVERLAAERAARVKEAQAAYEAGVRALARNDLAAAADNFGQAVRFDPYHGAAHNDLGVALYRQGDLSGAAAEFSAAAGILLGTHEPLYNLGVVLEDAGRLREAVEAYRSALRLAPDEVAVKEALARAYVKLDSNRQEAIGLLEEALKEDFRPEWQHWMQLQLLRLRGNAEATAQ